MGLLHYLGLFFLCIFFFAGLAVVLFMIALHLYAIFRPGTSRHRGTTYGYWDDDFC